MKIAILGFARDGKAAYEYWNHSGNELTICDQDVSLVVPEGAKSQLGSQYLQGLGQFDILVRTAGLPPKLIADANPETPDILHKVTGNVDEFFRVSPSQNIIGVTGTKGKGTTSTLIAKILEAAGYRVHLGGNIGLPALELLREHIEPTDWIVLEQSSFQLIDQKHSPTIGVCLMVVPEHLNWHKDMDEYITAKQQLFAHQRSIDKAIYFAENQTSVQVASSSPGQKIPYFAEPGAYIENGIITIDGQAICQTSELKLLGKHNWQNVCAAVTASWQVSRDIRAIKSVLTTFAGLEHRLQLVREFQDVQYYDDSFGTTPETAMVAIEAFSVPKIVILGGSDKGATYDELAETVKNNNVRHALTVGDTGPAIAAALDRVNFTEHSPAPKSMKEIVDAARSLAQPGDVVLLSTGCASFGLFKDYKDRGEQFATAVRALA
jgi:UDP-N-acetylmuramoylalanine--D-glutamate ligase